MKKIKVMSITYLTFNLLLILFIGQVYSQPYYYYSVSQDTTLTCNINRVDFTRKTDELFLSNKGRINEIFWNSDQTCLFINKRNSTLEVINLDSVNNLHRISGNFGSILNFYDVPIHNKFLIEFGDEDSKYKNTVVYNRSDYEPIDTFEVHSYGGTFLSHDESILYNNIWDKKGIFFSAYNIINEVNLFNLQRCSLLGPSPYYFGIEDGIEGKALIFFYKDVSENFKKQQFVVCKPDSGICFNPVNIPFRAKGYLSINTNYVIIEHVNLVTDDTLANIGHEIHTGEISIYNGNTGNKITDLSLPPNVQLMFFDNYPNMMYYFNKSNLIIKSIDLTALYDEQLKVKLEDSQGNLLKTGSLQYYDAGWKDAINNGNGTFSVNTEKPAVSLRMHYAGVSQTVSNIQAQNNSYTFTTISTTVKLISSQSELLDGGTVQYYASGWKDFGTATNGEATKELLPKEYSFRIKYSGASLDKKQNIGDNATVVFQTVNTKVQLKDSQGNLLDGGQVQYYAYGWKEFGTAINGEITKELLPKEYSFRMRYGGASLDQKQDIGENSIIVFQTISAKVQLKDSQGSLLDGGQVQYYASGWKNFGIAANGEVAKELLPKEYSFRMKYGGASLDQKQNIGTDAAVIFQTVNAKAQLKDSEGNFLNGGQVQYYASGWKDFGTATNGEATKELLPKEYSFRMKYGGASLDQKQDIGDNSIVVFQTISTKVQLKDSQGSLLDGGQVQYYASGWKDFGIAANGEVAKELLPKEYSFRMKYGGASLDQKQDISGNMPIIFSTVNCVIRVIDGSNQPIDNANVSYYASGWKTIGNTVNGEISKELLPKNYSFRANNNGINKDKKQDISENNIVEFIY